MSLFDHVLSLLQDAADGCALDGAGFLSVWSQLWKLPRIAGPAAVINVAAHKVDSDSGKDESIIATSDSEESGSEK